MNRRTLLAVTAGVGAIAGCLDDAGSDGQDDASEQVEGPPFEIELVDAPGSEAGTVSVPQSGQVTLINFTRQFCPTSEDYLETIGEAYDRLDRAVDVGPDGEAVVYSIIDWTQGATPTDEELAVWWREQDGHWPIGIDRSGAIFETYYDQQIPGTIVIDGDGDLAWRNRGDATASTIAAEVQAAIAA